MAEPRIAITPPQSAAAAHPVSESRTTTRTILLSCGILAALLYVAMLVFVPAGWPGYSSASQTVSELSAIGAPTRPLWVALGAVYTLLVVAFGLGIWESSGDSRPLRVVGVAMIACGVLGLFWPPMHLREVVAAGGGTLTDRLHIVWTMVSGFLTLLGMGFAAAAFGWRFRGYSIVTIVLLVAFGVLTSVDAPRLEANLPTPWMGVWERLNIAVWMLWLAVLAIALLHRPVVRRLP